MENRKGAYHGIYLPSRLDELCEEARKKLGMSRSRFIQYCITKTLQELSILSHTLHEGGEA